MYQIETPTQQSASFESGGSAHAASAPNPILDIPAITGVLWRRRIWVIGTVSALLLACLSYIILVPPQFVAVTQVLIDPRGLDVVEKQLTPQNAPSGGVEQVESQRLVLISDQVLRRVVDLENLATDVEFGAKQPGFLGRPKAFLRSLIKGSSSGETPKIKALRNLQAAVSTHRSKNSYVVDLSVHTLVPEKSARLANRIAQTYVETELAVRSQTAQRISQNLVDRAKLLHKSLREAEEEVANYASANKLVGVEGILLSEGQLRQMNEQLTLAKARTSQARARVEQIDSLNAAGTTTGAVSEAIKSTTMAQLRVRHASARQIVAQLQTTIGDKHPRLINARASVRNIQNNINEELSRITAAARDDLKRAQADENGLAQKLDGLKQDSVKINSELVRLRELERDAKANRLVYESFLVRAREIREQRGLETSSARVISPAFSPIDITRPSSSFLLALTVMFGCGLGAALALVREQFGNSAPPQVANEKAQNHPKMFHLPYVDSLHEVDTGMLSNGSGLLTTEGLPAVVYHRPESNAAGVFRRLDSHLRDLGGLYARRMVLLTYVDQSPPTGKSTVALNLALAAARAGDRVLLVDSDAQRQTLSRASGAAQFGLPWPESPKGPGEKSRTVVIEDDQFNIRFYSMVSLTGGINEASGTSVREALLNEINGSIDTVIIDGGALGSNTGANALADMASDILVVVNEPSLAPSSLAASAPGVSQIWEKLRGTVFVEQAAGHIETRKA